VTASSARGDVFLYKGAFKQQRLPSQWRAVGRIIRSRVPSQQKLPHDRHI
jgi:hypothetical protein